MRIMSVNASKPTTTNGAIKNTSETIVKYNFVMFCVFLYGPFCHGAHKLDLSTLFTIFFL